MGTLGAYFCGDFGEISEVIGNRLRTTGRTGCLVVIVFANANSKMFREHLRPYLGDWYYRSGDAVEFVFPGYQGLGDPREKNFKAQIYQNAYQDNVFVKATEEFEKRSAWRYSGEPSALIATLKSISHRDPPLAHLHLDSCIDFDLAGAVQKKLIDSVPKFFQGIIRFAKENPSYATAWNFGDRAGLSAMAHSVKDGVVECMAKWLKLDKSLPKTLKLAGYFAVKDLEK
jgi:hypothetical protein